MEEPTKANREPRRPTGRDVIRAVIRDPESVYVYWRLDGQRSAAALETLGEDCRWVLRVLNLTDGTSRRLPVDSGAGNYTVDVTPGETYGFELSASAAGRWRPVCRTEPVHVPPMAPKSPATPAVPMNRAPARGLGKQGPPTDEEEPPGLRFETTRTALGSSHPRRKDAD